VIVNLMMVFHDRNTTEYGGGAISVLYQCYISFVVCTLLVPFSQILHGDP